MSKVVQIDPETARQQALKAEIVRLMKDAVSDGRDPDDRLDDAKRALGCLGDVLCHVGEGPLDCLESENLAGFIRLVLAQFPAD